MNRAEVIARYRKAAELARAHGVPVHYRAGWTQRGRAGLTPTIIVEHDTSDPHRLSHGRLLDLLERGHGSIAGNAICNDAITDDGDVHILASGLAWHAGAGVWAGQSGNARALGTEYQRYAYGPLTPIQLRNGRIWTACRNVAFAIPPSHVCEHGEYARPRGRKRDRQHRPGVRVDGDAWRRSLIPTEEDDMTPAERAKLDQAAADAAAAKANTAAILERLGDREGFHSMAADVGRLRRGVRGVLTHLGVEVKDGP